MQQLHPTPIVYMPQLDALRALAVMAVAYSHWLPDGPKFGIPWGNVGVQLFFVLSGFLITDILIRARKAAASAREKAFALRSFYARRFLRIFPLYYAILAIGCLLDIPPFRETLGWTATYTVNFEFYFQHQWFGPISHFWSLAVEEQFYLVWPLLVLCVPAAWLKSLVLFSIALAVCIRLGCAIVLDDCEFVEVLPVLALDALGAGSLLAVLGISSESARRLARSCLWIGAPCSALLAAVAELGHRSQILGQLQHFSFLLFFVWLIREASIGFSGFGRRLLENRVLVGLGTISYGLYVLHNFALIPWLAIARRTSYDTLVGGPLQIFGLSFLTVVGAYLSWIMFERPLNNLKRFFPYRPQRHSEAAT